MVRRTTGLVTLQDLALRAGVGASTLNYYTNLGLIQVADRDGNRRLYQEAEALQQLGEIRRLRREGYPLRIIRNQIQEREVG